MMGKHNTGLFEKKKLLFDFSSVQPVGTSKRHGGGKYGEIVFKRILERGLPVACIYDGNRWLNPEIESIAKHHNIELYDLSKQSIQEIVDNHSFDVLFSPLPSSHLLSTKNISIIGTIHGLRRLETPADIQCLRYRNLSLKDIVFLIAKKLFSESMTKRLCSFYLKDWERDNCHIVTVSNHTANVIKYFFPELKDKKIPVFYSPSTSSTNELQRVYNEKYFMMVSGNRCEKNNLRAIMALDRLFTMGYLYDFKVKITGAKDASNFRYKLMNKQRFEFLGYVDDNELEQLYHDAYSLVYPSLNEGFGYPPLEAMHYGVPVLASSYSSISEVCQGAAMYFNPFAVEEIANRLLQIADEDTHKRYSDLAAKQYLFITEEQVHDLDGIINYIYSKNSQIVI